MSKFEAKAISLMTNIDGEVIVCLTATQISKSAARYTVREMMDANKDLSVEIKVAKSNRSLRQNAMLWSLIEKIAIEQSGSKRSIDTMDVYCDLLEQANCVSDYVLAKDDSELKKVYRAVRFVGEREIVSNTGEIITLNLYKVFMGSSKFNTKEMTELIECALDVCSLLDINDSDVELTRRTYRDV